MNALASPSFFIRHRGTVEAITPVVGRAVAEVDAGLPIVSMSTMKARLAIVTALETLVVRLLVCFAVLSLVIAALGHYAVAMFNMRRRTRVFGVRMALGASARAAGWRLVNTFGIVSRHGGLKNRDAGRLAQQRGSSKLIQTIGASHGITDADIEAVRPRLAERGMGLPVTVPVVLLFVLSLRRFTKWLRNRFEPDEWLGWVIAAAIGSVLISAVVLAICAGWALIVEIVRIGNEHIGRRGRTESLRDNFVVMFGIGIVASWIGVAIAALRLRRRLRRGLAVARANAGGMGWRGRRNRQRRKRNGHPIKGCPTRC